MRQGAGILTGMAESIVGVPGEGDASEEVDQLGPASTGRWLVHTRASLYIWDTDESWTIRLPLRDTVHVITDGRRVQVTRIDVWPTVGHAIDAWWQDPRDPAYDYRLVSSLVVSISRLRPDNLDFR